MGRPIERSFGILQLSRDTVCVPAAIRPGPGVDPATFANELGILAVQGFGDMGKRVCDSMIRDRFIAAQQN